MTPSLGALKLVLQRSVRDSEIVSLRAQGTVWILAAGFVTAGQTASLGITDGENTETLTTVSYDPALVPPVPHLIPFHASGTLRLAGTASNVNSYVAVTVWAPERAEC